jgi:hypothetical protein
VDRLVASLVRRVQDGGGEGEEGGTSHSRLVLLAGERDEEAAAGLAVSLWSDPRLATVLSHSGQHMDELLELAKELEAEAVVLAGSETDRVAFGDR